MVYLLIGIVSFVVGALAGRLLPRRAARSNTGDAPSVQSPGITGPVFGEKTDMDGPSLVTTQPLWYLPDPCATTVFDPWSGAAMVDEYGQLCCDKVQSNQTRQCAGPDETDEFYF